MFKFRTLCVFEPPFGRLGTTYDIHLGLIGKRVVNFLLMLIEVLSLRLTAEAQRAIIGFIDYRIIGAIIDFASMGAS